MDKCKNNKVDICNCNIIHKEKVDKVNKHMIEDNLLKEAAELLKVFGDKTRIKIINALSITEMCVCDLANVLNMTQSAISHQLRVLKGERLVKYRREGKIIYYSLDDDHVKKIFDMALEHVKE